MDEDGSGELNGFACFLRNLSVTSMREVPGISLTGCASVLSKQLKSVENRKMRPLLFLTSISFSLHCGLFRFIVFDTTI